MRFSASTAAAAVAATAGVASALDPAPVALQASDWLGIDGNWSTVSFLLGSNSDVVNVLISTTLSEFWAVGAGGCVGKESHCTTSRGGTYNPNKSKHWSTMGLWQLGLQTFGYNDNGEYGLDTVNAYSPITNIAFGMSNVLLAAMNTTNPYLGFFGLGIQQGRFGDIVADSPITQAVKSFGWTPSYSYGYTAGAHYRNTVVSATLGGYDSARFVPHDTAFTLEQGESIPHTLVRGIQVTANNSKDQPDVWSSPVEILSDWNSSFTAMIDSSTPYLWLPEPVCTRFAEALNLTYNSTYELYTLSNELYRDYTSNKSLSFTFSLTSFDNHDNFGLPLEVPGLVNITLPLKAFVSLLEYPFARGAIKYGDPAVPYFTLRKSKNDTFVIGRTFLQESYLITKFDESLFSVHQALFPANAERDANLVPIRQPSNSPYPPPPRPHQNEELTTGQMVGIAVGAVLLCTVIVVGCCYLCRRGLPSRRGKKSKDEMDDHNDSASTLAPDSPITPVSRILSKIACRKHSQFRKGASNVDKAGTINGAAVGGACNQTPLEAPDGQIYELSASSAPIELDAGSDRHSIGEMELTTEIPPALSAYEAARIRMERQLRGPVPAYSPPATGTILPPEKSTPHPRPLDTSHAMLQPSPTSPMPSAAASSQSNSSITPELSPISPRGEWYTHSTMLPSPVAGSMPSRLPGTPYSWIEAAEPPTGTSRSNPENAADFIPPTSFQRTTADYSKVVCLGPLPSNLQKTQRDTLITRLTGPEGRGVSNSLFKPCSRASEGSLGSNFTEEEEMIAEELTRQASSSQAQLPHRYGVSTNESGQELARMPFDDTGSAKTQRGFDSTSTHDEVRLDPGRDLIHVPQLADKRYSWEDQ